ncbi:RHS repeat domain-containing protein [Simkania negevensis]|uniref:Teneurin-like YD-shell domain-containing protein n=1 Tax=Simkania negevensis (strain ATCC VR-1471 / DSM 27360 / Z) TaxID=331113 RepID=F8L429_SIMNZ|nr:RHS repeat protein [Simkania negevensis]CCB90060.1 hypothetical protein SNE_A21830 [Simkania negevensis Z]
MLKKILVFLLPLAALFPDADMMSDFAGDPLAIVESSVNVITGDFVVRRDDLIVKGHEPICIPLNYSPKNVKHTIGRYGGWDFAENYLTIHLDYTDTFRVYEKSGLCLEYFYNLDCVNRNSAKPFTLNQDFAGWANTFLKDISARNNPMNNVVYSKPQKPQRIIIECPDGSKRYYWTDTSHQTLKKCGINRSAPIEFRLQKEKLPNGNKIFYHWKKLGGERWRVKRIESQSLDGSVYAWVSIRYEPEHDKHRKGIEFVTSDGRSIKYQFDSDYNLRGKRISLLKNVNYSFKPSIKYHYYQSKKSEIYPEWIESPDMRRMHIRYYEKGYNGDSGVALEHKDPVKDARYARVEALYQPLFQTEKVYRSHLFRYSPGKYGKGEGSTDVFDAQMNLTRYDYNHNFLMKFILRYFDENKLFSKEVFNWTENNWLQTRALVGEDNIPLYAVKYGYDQYGNIQRECHYGNLTGTKDPHCLILEGTKIECYTGDEFIISRSYNDQHLLIQETFPNGKVINYRYLKDTNLLCAKIEKDTKHNHQRRTFYFYNNSILTGEVVDNGHEECWDQLGDVTERLIKSIQPNLHKFMYGMPYVIEEKYKDKQSGEEVLLSKQVIHYDTDQYGNASRIDHYDAHGEFLYTLNFTYDGRDRLASQTDPVGRKRTFEYDANHNPTLGHDPNENFTLTQKYDYMNRPILTEQKTPEGATRHVINRYNALGHKVEEEDFRGIIIKQDYNPFGYPIQTIFPDMMTDQGKKSPVIRRTFNAMGKPLTETDPEGHTTQTWYTARGKPYRILHPDGSEEFFTYDASGYNITSHTSAERVCTTWDYDAFDRMTEKKIFSLEGNLLMQEAFTYDAFNLLSKTDPDGVVTIYEYDGAGRKIREETLGRVTAYEYDSRGHLHRVIRNEEQVLVKEYDLLDRVTEERHEDKDGLIYSVTTYTYDDFSNTIALTKEVQVGESIERLFYDPFRRLIKGIDPMGHTTTIDYDDYYKNELGQKVLRKITTDPMGRKTLETFDVFGNLVSLEKQNASGKTLVHEAFFYNLNQKKTKQVSTLFDPDKTIIKTWDYDSRSRLIELREAVGEPIEKVTHYTYTLDGHLETITKPDGKTITYTYDGLGRQTSIHTSDGSCHYTLKYDQMGYVLESHDLIHGKVTKRTYSHFGELLSETQANHQSLENTYDSLGRRTAMSFANGSKVLYDYTPYHMEKVERISSSGTSLYTHYYTEYDRSFNLTEERLLSKEPLYHTVDLLSRRIESDSPYSNERITYIDSCGNVRGYKRTLDKAIETSTFEYDDLNQLVQEYGLYNHNYACDAHHNRLQKDDSTYSVNPLHELEATSEGTYEHDLNGNRISSSKNQSQYAYDGLDRLVQMRSGDLAIRFSYDSDCVEKIRREVLIKIS